MSEKQLPPVHLTRKDRAAIAEILDRRANDVSSFQSDVRTWTGGTVKEYPGSVQLALQNETRRLRKLADKVRPPEQDDEEEED